jgi:excisionase family DNA binding protein
MSRTHDLLTVAEAASELGIGPSGVRMAIAYGTLRPVRIDRRTNMIERTEVERYRREHLGQRGKRKKPAASSEPVE